VLTLPQYNVQFGVDSDRALEEIGVDQSQNVVEYQVTETSPRRDDTEVWAISDFNRVSAAVNRRILPRSANVFSHN